MLAVCAPTWIFENHFAALRSGMVHTGAMATASAKSRQSVSLPRNLAAQVSGMAKRRRVSTNKVLVTLIENGLEAEKRKQEEFDALARQFREATDPEEVKRLGDRMGKMIFG